MAVSFVLSPNKRLLVVANFHNSVDWYTIEDAKYVNTTCFYTKEYFKVQVQFTGLNTIIVGHSRGCMALMNMLTQVNPERLYTCIAGTQLIAVSVCNGRLTITAASTARTPYQGAPREAYLHIIRENHVPSSSDVQSIYTSGEWADDPTVFGKHIKIAVKNAGRVSRPMRGIQKVPDDFGALRYI
ncbi:hypothetical protein DXG01_014871 [Tephrocybe rancida]|nr:hypothetical protein DXG01_014871 [Tephrocybe rancida]